MADADMHKVVENLREYIALRVAAGFEDPEDIAASAVEVFAEEADPAILEPIAGRLTREAVAAHLADQATWPEVTDCDRLDRAMAELTRNGIVCRQNFSCCGNCGVAEIGEEIQAERRAGVNVRGYAFYHMQDTEAAAEGHGVFLNYGALKSGEAAAVGVAKEIVAALQEHGLAWEWNGKWSTRIHVDLEWRRRSPQPGGA